jgi:hypothetical protein
MNEHLSSQQITNLLLDEVSETEQRHLSECASCRAELDHLRNAFSLYRRAGQEWSEHWMTQGASARQPSGPRWFGWWAVGSALTIAALAAVFVFLPSTTFQRAREEPFVSIPYVVPAASYERTQVIRMEVPVAALRSSGMAVQTRDAGNSVRADVLVGQDGRALAVRLVERRLN